MLCRKKIAFKSTAILSDSHSAEDHLKDILMNAAFGLKFEEMILTRGRTRLVDRVFVLPQLELVRVVELKDDILPPSEECRTRCR